MVDVAPAPAMTNADYAREKSPYYAHRIDLFDKYYARELTRVEEAKARGEPGVVTLPDGEQKGGNEVRDESRSISRSVFTRNWRKTRSWPRWTVSFGT